MATNDISDIWIKLSYWFLNNRKDLLRWWVLVLIAVNIFFVAYVATNGVIVLMTYFKTQRLVSEIGASRVIAGDITTRNSPQPLQINRIETIPESTTSSLVVADITNPNTGWTAKSITYHFAAGSQALEPHTSFALPNERRILLVSEETAVKPTMAIDHVTWIRSPAKTLPDVKVTFAKGEHQFVNARADASQKLISQITTKATNTSLYTIKTVKGVVVVKSGTQIVGAKQFFIDTFTSKETRDILIQFSDALPPFTTIEFYPEINTLDPTVLKP